MTFLDVEVALVVELDQFASGRTGTETPANLQAALPFIRVTRRGGPDDHVSDYPRVDVDVFAATRAAGVALSSTIRDHLRFGFSITGVDRVVTESSAQELPWEDPGVRRWTSTFQVVTRRA